MVNTVTTNTRSAGKAFARRVWKRAVSPIGLDAGNTAVRAAQLNRTGDRYQVARSSVDLPEARRDGDESVATLTERIRGCIQRGEFRGRKVRTALCGPDLEHHALELPEALVHAESDAAEQVVHIEIGRLISGPIDKYVTRHWDLPATAASRHNAIGVAVRSDLVSALVGVCRGAGLLCMGVDAGATALARFGGLLRPWSDGEVWGLLDLGLRQSRLMLCVDDVPVLVRSVGPGGGEWTARIAESLQLSEKAAEVHKRQHGIALHIRGAKRESDAPANDLSTILLTALRSDLNNIAGEIKRSYEYVLSCYPQRQVADLVLVGGGASLHNLPEFLGHVLGIPVRRASEYLEENTCRLGYASGRGEPLENLALAIGLAVEP